MPRSEQRDEFHRFGLASWCGKPQTWTAFHRHDEIELDYVEAGEVTYRFSYGRVVLRPGDFAVFWGAVPHQSMAVAEDTVLHWLTVPLGEVREWQLPTGMTQRLLGGMLSLDRDPADVDRFKRWHRDLSSGNTQRRLLVLLEVQVRLRRLALTLIASRQRNPRTDRAALGKVERMAAYMAEHSTEALRVAQIARVANLHPDYAATMFRKACGMGLIDYLTLQRVAHAQRLLVTTDRDILDIAFTCGFGSASRFYDAFARLAGKTPRAFRNAMQTSDSVAK